MMRNLLAFDLGASNGRAILGQFDGEKITMRPSGVQKRERWGA